MRVKKFEGWGYNSAGVYLSPMHRSPASLKLGVVCTPAVPALGKQGRRVPTSKN